MGKVALVTGGASGIGETIVRLFQRHGAKACIADVNDKLGKQLVESLDAANTCFVHCDVTKEDDVASAVDSTVEKFGSVDIMVNNAGIADIAGADIRGVDLASFKRVLDINVAGVLLGIKHAARVMVPQKSGNIVNMSSMVAAIGGIGPHGYTASKHAVLGLMENAAADLGEHGIRVNCVSPYAIAGGMGLSHLPKGEKREEALQGYREFVGKIANLQGVELTMEDVANAVLFLASDDARYISGMNLLVDGAFTRVNHQFRVQKPNQNLPQ